MTVTRGTEGGTQNAHDEDPSLKDIVTRTGVVATTLTALASGSWALLKDNVAWPILTIMAFCLVYLAFHLCRLAWARVMLDRAAVSAELVSELERLRGDHKKLCRDFATYRESTQIEWERYRGAITRFVDRQSLLYEEELELTIIIGADDSGDRVVERHITKPTPYLFYRSMRPILPRNGGPPPSFEDLDLRVVPENDESVTLTVLPLVPESARILIIMEPPVHRTLIWQLSYRPIGLWRPLRRGGIDELTWDARTPLGHGESTYSRFLVRFCFPEGTQKIRVWERGHRGTAEQGSTPREIIWRDESPQGVRYEWDLSCPGIPAMLAG